MQETKTEEAPAKAEVSAQTTFTIAGGCEQYRSLVQKYDWNVDIALAVMQAESSCISDRDNTGLNYDGSNDKGLMQINSIHSNIISDLDRLDPVENIRAAYEVYRGSGWKAWSAYNNGSYLKFL